MLCQLSVEAEVVPAAAFHSPVVSVVVSQGVTGFKFPLVTLASGRQTAWLLLSWVAPVVTCRKVQKPKPGRVAVALAEFGQKDDWLSKTLLRHYLASVIQVFMTAQPCQHDITMSKLMQCCCDYAEDLALLNRLASYHSSKSGWSILLARCHRALCHSAPGAYHAAVTCCCRC